MHHEKRADCVLGPKVVEMTLLICMSLEMFIEPLFSRLGTPGFLCTWSFIQMCHDKEQSHICLLITESDVTRLEVILPS
jgi:hypothetical protein